MSIVKERIIQCTLYYNMSGNRLSSTMYYGCDSPLAIDSPEDFRLAWETACLPAFQAAVADSVFYDRIAARSFVKEQCYPGNDQLFNKQGGVAETPIPENLAAVLQFRQDEVSSRNNGRIFLSGLTQGQVVDGLITLTAVNGVLNDIGTALLGTIVGGSGRHYNLVVLQRRALRAPITPVGHIVTVFHVSRAVASQRRRKTELQSYQ